VAPVDATAAMFVCVTGPLSPALSIRTLTFTFVGAVWTAAGDDGDVGRVVTVSGVVSTELAMVSALESGSTTGIWASRCELTGSLD
jgi:hypothetical protein